MPQRILVRHLGNMGDHLFLISPLLAQLKKKYPQSHITLLTTWGYKDYRGRWGMRNQGGHNIALMMHNPHHDQLVHWHDQRLSLHGHICQEEGRRFPTWSRAYYEKSKEKFDKVIEADFGLRTNDHPLQRIYAAAKLPPSSYGWYEVFLSPKDRSVGAELAATWPRPRILFLEGLAGKTMRGWDSRKVIPLTYAIRQLYGVVPRWFGSAHAPRYHGRPITLRENIAYAAHADIAIGVMSGPLHFVAGVQVPTITLYGGQPLWRAAPSYYLNPHLSEQRRHHVTILGPTCDEPCFLKRDFPCKRMLPALQARCGFRSWAEPGMQNQKSCVAMIPVSQVVKILLARLSLLGYTPRRRINLDSLDN
jgi:hypothetical protein